MQVKLRQKYDLPKKYSIRSLGNAALQRVRAFGGDRCQRMEKFRFKNRF